MITYEQELALGKLVKFHGFDKVNEFLDNLDTDTAIQLLEEQRAEEVGKTAVPAGYLESLI